MAQNILNTFTVGMARFQLLNSYSVPGNTIRFVADVEINAGNGGPLFCANQTTLDLGGRTITGNWSYQEPAKGPFNYIPQGIFCITCSLGPSQPFTAAPNCLWHNAPGNVGKLLYGKVTEPFETVAPVQQSGPRSGTFTEQQPIITSANGSVITNGYIHLIAGYCLIEVRFAKNVTISRISGNGTILLIGCEDCTVDGCNVNAIQLSCCSRVKVTNNSVIGPISVEEMTSCCDIRSNVAGHFFSNDATCTSNVIDGNTFTGTPGTGSIQFQGGAMCVISNNTCTLGIGLAQGTWGNVLRGNTSPGVADVNRGATGNRVDDPLTRAN